MNIDQAIQILNNATGQLKLTRNEHIQIQLAMDVVRGLATSAKTNEEAKKPIDKTDKSLA